MKELNRLTITEAARGLRKKEFSSVEITKSVLDAISKQDGRISSFITVAKKEALEKAKRADGLISTEKNLSPLVGIPSAVKDVLLTEGTETTAASKILKGFVPPYSASVVGKLEALGYVLVGKTNLDEFAMGASTENSAYFTTKNPWNLKKVPGGSSGGSAAAVAADMCIYSLGSDTGGSIRQPASFCGVVGLKPTYGRVSRYGLIAMASSLDQIGPITKTVEDAALVLQSIAGFDPKDSTTLEKEVENYKDFLGKGVKGLKIGVPKEFLSDSIDSVVKDTSKRALERFATLGAELVDISLPTSKDAVAVYYLIMPSEVSSNMARYDGVRFGGERETLGAEVKRRILLGTYSLSSGYIDAYYLKAAKVRTLISREFSKAFEKADLIVGPTSPVLPFDIGERSDDPLQMYLADLLTIPANLAGLPAVSIPCGLAGGLPVGLQIIGNHWQEGKVLQAAHAYEQNFKMRERPDL